MNSLKNDHLYLLLCPAQHADSADIIGVLSQSPLSFDPLTHCLRDIDRLQEREPTEETHSAAGLRAQTRF